MKVCPNCGKQYPDDANFCPTDAGRLEQDAGDTQRGYVPSGVAAAPSDGAKPAPLGGRFVPLGPIGGGLTGQVYQATDRQSGQTCAVKLVNPAVFPNSLLLQRAERELKQLERVDLPEVARVLAHGRQADALWIAMELVAGMELGRLIVERGPLPALAGCRLVRQVAHGLAETAKQGVIHRDLAGKNVLVGDGDAVKIINFPIAVPFSERVQGVAEFLSPEQVEGKPADQRSSIYSLGALLYFAVTGRPPFVGEPADVHRAHLSGEVVRPSTVAPIPDAVEAVIMKALEKASAKRFMTLHQMIGELDAVLSGQAAAQPAAAAQGKVKMPIAPAAQTLVGVGVLAPPGSGPVVSPVNPAVSPSGPVGLAPAQVVGSTTKSGPMGVVPAPAAPVLLDVGRTSRPVVASGELGSGRVSERPRVQAPPPVAASRPTDGVARPSAVIAPTPPSTPALTASPAGANASRGKAKVSPASAADMKGKFRETMWFKKGELDEAAAAAAAAAREGELLSDKADALPIEDRYRDDGTLEGGDAERFSLRTGSTNSTLKAHRAEPLARRRVSERELVGELRSGRLWLYLFILVLLAGIGAGIYYIVR